ncbi:Hypothetical protein D9617_4g000870 [Elsinoe fawcettii]|nr:Hypothetical protein D9617_4g000870 [Elsinoe fawcettii]
MLPAAQQPDREEIFDKAQALLGLPQAQHARKAFDHEDCTQIRPLHDAVYMCIDIEASEKAQDKITEVGIAMLDTRVIQGMAPGEAASAWLEKIIARHYITKDFIDIENTDYVKGGRIGAKHEFAFGTSDIISIGRLKNYLRYDLGHPPYPDGDVKERRPIVLVGHGMQNDLKYLKTLTIELGSDANVVCMIDTQELSSYASRPAGLDHLLQKLGIDTCASNARNDAVRTLQALVKMVFLNAYYSKLLNEVLEPLLYLPVREEDLV